MPTLKLSDYYSPWPKQQEFHASDVFELLFGGAAGGGKSRALRWEAIISCLTHPGFIAVIFRREYPDLEETHIRACRLEIPQTLGTYRESKHNFDFKNGSVLEFRHLDREADLYGYQSAEWDLMCIDQAEQFTEFEYLYLRSRVRSTKPGISTRIRLSANPGNIGHVWLKRYFVDPAPWGEVYVPDISAEQALLREWGVNITLTPRTRQFIPAKVTDNPSIMENDPNYIITLYNLPERERRMLLDGDWDVATDQVFDNWSRKKHVVAPFSLPDNWIKWVGIDWGYANPLSAGWYARDPETTRIYRYRGVYLTKLTDMAQAKLILALSEGERIWTYLADPSVWHNKPQQTYSTAKLWRECGLNVAKAANDRINGIRFCRQMLEPLDDGVPAFQVFDNSQNRDFIRVLPSLTYSKTNPEDVDPQAEDHVLDEFRYAMTVARPKIDRGAAILRYNPGAIIRYKHTKRAHSAQIGGANAR